jgi:dihydrolipoamide dehydrogenase
MSEAKRADAVVIGGGPGGYVCAIRLAQLGRNALVVEKEAVGGVCLNVGCIPSKALINASKTADKVRSADKMGVGVSGLRVDLEKMQDWKEGIVSRLTSGVGQLLKGNGVKVLPGTARLRDRTTVEVDGPEGKVAVETDHIVLATGSRPIQIPGFPFDEETVLSSTGALALRKVPPRLLVIGGGYIGLELGTVYSRLGSEVTVVEMMDQLLPGTDPDLVKVVHRGLKKRKVKVHLESRAVGMEQGGAGIVVQVEGAKGAHSVECDKVLVSVGRRPNTENLGLEAAGVQVDEHGLIPTDQRCRTNVEGIYAIGDICHGLPLAHKASKEGEVAAEAIAGRPGAAMDVRAMPAVVFTEPEIATVGLSETEAREAGHEVRVGSFPFAASGRAMTTQETDGLVKVVADAGTDEVLGVQMVGPGVSDLIAEAALAVEMGASAADIGLTVHAHPTLAEALMEAAKAVHGEAVHILNK